MNKYMTNKYKINLGKEVTNPLVYFMIGVSFMFTFSNHPTIENNEIFSIFYYGIYYAFFIIIILKNLFSAFNHIRKVADQEKRKSLLKNVILLLIGFFVLLTIFKFLNVAFLIILIVYIKIFLYYYI